ncbi:MAG: AAA family ATPase [Chloroflexi bacterium]|nr:AAA family ATPase [Chloroflexota bacterium]
MLLKRARIYNFKLLEDVEVDFSVDRARSLTVIRAENASGKTSLLTALQWGLYGEQALEDRAVPLSSSHWPAGVPCEISAELAFSHTAFTVVAGQQQVRTREYLLKRVVTELVEGGRPQRPREQISLLELTDRGAETIPTPGQLLEQILSADLRHVFFTNGDAAMNFISPQLTRTDKRNQVRDTIKALLEISVIEDAIQHVKRVQAGKRRETGSVVGGNVAQLASKVNELGNRLEGLEAQKKEISDAVADLAARHERADRALQEALQRGNHEELARQLASIKERLNRAHQMRTELSRQHQGLFNAEALSWSLMDPGLRAGVRVLNQLHDAGVIPKTAIPVLRDRLVLERCICGASLAPGTPAREAVEGEIARQRASDAFQQQLTRLYHQAEAGVAERDAGHYSWDHQLELLITNRTQWDKTLREWSAEEDSIRKQIEAIDRADIEEKRQHRKAIESALTEKREQLRQVELDIAVTQQSLTEVRERYDKARKQDNKLRRVNAQLTATQDVLSVLDGVMEELQGVYLDRVSRRMDELFRRMIAADVDLPDQMRVITGASITPDFDILVHAGNRTLNPDHELNGASQRALTFAFIWALTEVSDTVAPRVIDTPLGMMSGYVKRSVLDLISAPAAASEPDRQVVLFLTRSEIAQVENLLDQRAGVVFTLTNTAAGDLTCRQEDTHPRIVRCECNHRQYCEVCSRLDDATYGLVPRE